ncbi:Uncharacterised protein [Fusobacterium necrophorum subsp. necrophorum]|nr:Uncharacterised protein [Fusobacterium necrophorum subsp. necrophorum]
MSRLQLVSNTEKLMTEVLYTPQRPVANLYAKKDTLERFNLNEKNSKKSIEAKQMSLTDIFEEQDTIKGKKKFQAKKNVYLSI